MYSVCKHSRATQCSRTTPTRLSARFFQLIAKSTKLLLDADFYQNDANEYALLRRGLLPCMLTYMT